MQQSGTRLNKFLAVHLGIGRREADNLIASGKVQVNGVGPVLGSRVKDADRVEVGGKVLTGSQSPGHIYLLMNKPTGYVCSKSQQGDTPTIYSLLPEEYKNLKTVGRLDKDSSGIILLTNDGDLAHKLTHPSFAKLKKYEVTLDKPLEPLHHQMINDNGLQLPDGPSRLGLESISDGDSTSWLVTMHEGRNRQIRRTFLALGYKVVRLNRTQFGDFSLNGLALGQTRQTTP
jgi:23S rRNA pseudouridine2605 synthase